MFSNKSKHQPTIRYITHSDSDNEKEPSPTYASEEETNEEPGETSEPQDDEPSSHSASAYEPYYSSGYQSYDPYNEQPVNTSYGEPSYHQNTEGSSDCTCGVPEHRVSRIYRGDSASHEEFPWLIKVVIYGIVEFNYEPLTCGGALITFLHFVSVSHCYVLRYDYIDATLSNGDIVPVDHVKIHETYYYHHDYQLDDISVGFLKERVRQGESVVPICLPFAHEDFTDDISTTAGWGSLYEGGPKANGLHKVILPILSREECSRSDHYYPISENAFCAGYLEGGPASCKGDSGGPVMVGGVNGEVIIAGINSYSKGCGQPGFPGVKTKVSRYVAWVVDKIGNEQLCDRPYY